MKNLMIPSLMTGYMGVANLMANPDLQTRAIVSGILVIIMILQGIIFANAMYLPKWYQRCQLLAMVFVFGAIVMCVAVPVTGLMLSGILLLIAFIGMLMAASVVTIQRDHGAGRELMKRYWYLPLILILIVLFLFAGVEDYRQKYGDSETEKYARIAAATARKNEALVNKTLAVSTNTNERVKGADIERKRIANSFGELNDNISELIIPLKDNYGQMAIDQKRIIIGQQKLIQQCLSISKQLNEIEYQLNDLKQNQKSSDKPTLYYKRSAD